MMGWARDMPASYRRPGAPATVPASRHEIDRAPAPAAALGGSDAAQRLVEAVDMRDAASVNRSRRFRADLHAGRRWVAAGLLALALDVAAEPLTIVITGAEQAGFSSPMSFDVVTADEIRDGQPRVNLSEALVRVPGLLVLNRANYAQDLQVASRGFGARAAFGIRGVRVIVDDIPATMPDGQGQAASVNLGTAERIEVLRGPLAVIYGNAAGGVIKVVSEEGRGPPAAAAAVLAGGYGARRGEVKFGGAAPSLNYTLNASQFHTDGYREHSAATREQVGTKLTYVPDADTTLTLVANHLHQPDTQDPLGLTRAQFEADPRQADPAATNFNTRKSIDHTQGGLVYTRNVSERGTLKARVYAGTRAVGQYLAVPVGAQTPATSSGGVIDLDREFGGLGVGWTHRGGPLTVNVGLDYDRSEERRRGYENFDNGTLGVRGDLRRDELDTVYNFDQYAQAQWDMAQAWSLLAGVRRSRVAFDAEDFYIAPGNPDDSGAVTYRRTNPVAGLLFRATPALNLYVNAGRGFETPTFAELAYRPDGSSGLNFSLRPSVSRSVEAGAKWRPGAGPRFSFAVFHTDVTDEIVPASNAGGRTTFQNAPRTERYGAELSLDGALTDAIDFHTSYTLLEARFEDAFSYRPTAAPETVTVPAGNRLPGVARTAAYAELAWRRGQPGWSAAFEAVYRGRVFVNDVNSDTAGRYAVGNLRVMHTHGARRWRWSEFVRVDNVTDRNYIGSVIVNDANGRVFEPAAGRSIALGLELRGEF
jgi:iron complex outermembrane receptor protein